MRCYNFRVRMAAMEDAEAQLRLQASTSGLADRVPFVSARRLLTAPQRNSLLALAGLLVIGLVLSATDTLVVVLGAVTFLYVTCVGYRALLLVRSGWPDAYEVVSDEEARRVPDYLLPTYTVLVPAYREPEVINRLIDYIGNLDYPLDRLEVMILVEADDDETISAINSCNPGSQFQLVPIPPSQPRTKPKALNFGLTLARGDLVAVYDVEDEPDALQLRKAAVVLERLGPNVGCLQARLSYDNPNQNLITRWFTIEYTMWFSFWLPGLAASHAPIPLGGTSNHFRRSVLRSIGGWDPYNVTEDADLGIRMAREGYDVRVLDSVTNEEANSDFVNWVKQRSRWYKGYIQTFFVHMRSPRQLYRELGFRRLIHFLLFVGGTPVVAMLNPVFWVMAALWVIGHPVFLQRIFPAPSYYLALVSLVFGNFLLGYMTVMTCRVARRGELLWAALTIPLYWIMMSLASVKAWWQLVQRPTFWEKTAHGLRSGADGKSTLRSGAPPA